MASNLEIENMNPTDVKWEILKDVYNKEISKDIKKRLIGAPAPVIMMFIMSIVPALKIDNDTELLELQNRLFQYHNNQMIESLMFTKGVDNEITKKCS